MSTVSIMPGMEARAPERTETSSGFCGIAEGAAGELADLGERLLDLAFELRRIGLAVVVVIGADLGGDGEARRHRQAQIGHLGEVRPLAAEQVLHPRLALGLAVAEGIDPLRIEPPRYPSLTY